MAFDLKTNNLSGVSVILNPDNSLRPTPENFINLYDYAQQYVPELIPELMYANGKGSILGFIRATTMGKEGTFHADTIQHAEMGRLENSFSATATGNVFTCAEPHMLRVREVVKISNGVKEFQGIVSAITSATVMTVLSDGAAFTFAADTVQVFRNSNRFQKGDTPFVIGKKWDPRIYTNYAHIIKDHYSISDSDLVTKTWIETPNGPRWYNTEMERFYTQFDNLAELTAVTHQRATDSSPSAAAGFAQGMKGVIQQVEERGNISNEYIETIEDLGKLALRAKNQGNCREFTIYCDHEQIVKFQTLAGGVNAGFVTGSNFGAFNNKREMALNLDFVSIFYAGVQFHFTSWALLDSPELLASAKFDLTSLAFLMVPTGSMNVNEQGNVVARPYLDMRYRSNNITNRHRQAKFWGVLGQQVKEDRSGVDLLTEMTAQVVGANNFFVGRKAVFY